MFQGSIAALVTPFKNGALDEQAYQDHIEWLIDQGTHGVVPVGTTGESPTLSHAEHKRAVELCVEVVNGRVSVIAGSGSNSTAEAIELTKHAKDAGADGALVVTPYYNKPNQEGLYQHFKAVAEAADIPVVVYNIPPRSVIDMTPETMGRLAKDFSNIVAVKDATGKLDRVAQTRLACGTDFIQLSGDDITAAAFRAMGGVGCISVTANVAPKMCADFQNLLAEQKYAEALEIQDKLAPLHMDLFCEPNPVSTKYALSKLGRMSDEVRLPLVTTSAESKAKVEAALRHAGLID